MGKLRGKTGAKERCAERRLASFRWRAAGCSYQQIADKVGVSVYAAWHDVQDRLKEIAKLEEPIRETVRVLELTRLDILFELAMKQAQAGEPRGIPNCIRVMERRAAMLGLDAPQIIEAAGAGGGPITVVWGHSDREHAVDITPVAQGQVA